MLPLKSLQALILRLVREHASSLLAVIHKIITDPAYHDYLAILKGARNGLVYGAKVRFPHALVMTLLFSSAG